MKKRLMYFTVSVYVEAADVITDEEMDQAVELEVPESCLKSTNPEVDASISDVFYDETLTVEE